VNTVGPLCKEMAEEMGFDDWEKCTGHGLRKMGITHAMTYAETNIARVVLGASRHKSYQTSLRYQKPNDDMYMAYNKAICGRHVLSPPKQVRTKRQKKGKTKEPNNNNEDIDDDNHFTNEFNDAIAVSYGSGTTIDLRENDKTSNIGTISTDDNRSMASTMNSKPEVVQNVVKVVLAPVKYLLYLEPMFMMNLYHHQHIIVLSVRLLEIMTWL
jgi:hypothetical protein